MTEVIELLSSSPPHVPVVAKESELNSKANGATNVLAGFGIDDFDITGDLSFRVDQPGKRRKLSHGSGQPTKSSRSSKAPLPIELSSEPDLPEFPTGSRPVDCARPNTAASGTHIDDIGFSSSAPELRRQKRSFLPDDIIFDLSSESLPDDPFQLPRDDRIVSSQPFARSANRKTISTKNEGVLADLTNFSPVRMTEDGLCADETGPAKLSVSRARMHDKSSLAALVDEIIVSSPPKRHTKKRNQPTEEAIGIRPIVNERATIKASKKAEKDLQKAVELETKRREKENLAKQKQIAADKAEVNKSKINKSDTTCEMIVEMCSSLQDTSVGNQVLEYLKELNVETHFVDEEVNLANDGEQFHYGINIVRWKRKVTSQYDKDRDEWTPIASHRVQAEQHFIVYLAAVDFIRLAAGYANGADELTARSEDIMRQNVDLYMSKIRSKWSNCTPILLIQGLDAWLKKNANARNREYTAAVRAKPPVEEEEPNSKAPLSSQVRTRKRKKSVVPAIDLSFVTLDAVDGLMLHLQLNHQPIVIQRTTSPATSASEIVKFTQHLSTRPGRIAFQQFNLKSASFCMESGQVKTGDNARETYVKMLQEVQRITPSMAYGIAAEYDSVLKLVQGFRQANNLMLEDVRKSTNRDGGWSDKRLGPMVSRRLYKIFMGTDPAATDGMS